ncbi:hypothetical protein NLJ89_g9839 [Agrocybe chaxingu]|uniref:Uncharacterized protein n=1 Tax=Agrocybe chaxingu TaxID=84603 RepID=A0A9W8JSU0_9AGAR|nr:hypothetical protein NLJ89_g9839 [Agrocybe chaxingu]
MGLVVIQAILNVSLVCIGVASYLQRGPKKTIFPQSLYSPVQGLLGYETKVFYEGFGEDKSVYQRPPSPEPDAAWEDLYKFGISRITKEEASHLVNYTYHLPGDEDHYVVQLDVFHQLHCLNMLRKAISADCYTETNHFDAKHWSHCIESIRQSPDSALRTLRPSCGSGSTEWRSPAMPFPLALLPTIPDNLDKLKARDALLYQNTFMKNALIRGLNVLYDVAPKVTTGSQSGFQPFMEYVDTVCDMLILHIQGDEEFFQALAQHCKSFRWSANKTTATAVASLNILRRSVSGWKKDPKTFSSARLLVPLTSMEGVLLEVLHKQVPKFKSEALPQAVSDDQLAGLIKDNMIWLASNSDVTVLLPFCMSHHDPKTSKHWPPVSEEAIKAMPGLVNAHPAIWKLAPFDPITKQGKKLAL